VQDLQAAGRTLGLQIKVLNADAGREIDAAFESIGRAASSRAPTHSDLPVMQSSKLELVVNANTARMLGLSAQQLLLATAKKVIE
jgi:hypothetical protein